MLTEKLKTAENESYMYKSELNNEKESCFRKLQDSEGDRIKFKTENTLLNERYSAAKIEIDELRMKLNCEFSEKLAELESQNRLLKDEVRKKDNDIKDLTNEQLKQMNDSQKKIALIE